MKVFHAPVTALVLGIVTLGGQAMAAEWTDRISIGGFASANYNRTSSEVPFNGEENVGHDDKGSWSGTRMGVNIQAQINKRFRFASQFFASKAENFGVSVDWAFSELMLSDELALRTGRIKFPVGIVNEYTDVGYSMPWIRPPAAIYSELGTPYGPQITRESYTGASLLGNLSAGDWTLGADLFGGEILLENASVRGMGGISLTADWDDTVLFQASANQGTMHGTGSFMGGAMEGTTHQSIVYGIKADWNNILVYAERGDVSMGSVTPMNSTSWYTTVGYQMGSWLPHLTYQDYEKETNGSRSDKQRIVTLGLRWDFMPSVAFKVELSQIKTDQGVGLFVPEDPIAGPFPDNSVNMVGLGLDTVF